MTPNKRTWHTYHVRHGQRSLRTVNLHDVLQTHIKLTQRTLKHPLCTYKRVYGENVEYNSLLKKVNVMNVEGLLLYTSVQDVTEEISGS